MGLSSSKILKKIQAEAVLVTCPYNLRYVSGFCGGEGLAYVSQGRRVLITDSRYTQAAAQETDFDVVEWNRKRSKEKILKELLAQDGITRVAYEEKAMLAGDFFALSKQLSGVREWVPVKDALEELRMVKTPEEIDCLAKAEHIGDEAFVKLLGVIRPGMTELEVVAELEYLMRKAGGEGTSFDTIAASGIHSSMPHAIPTTKKLCSGDFLTLDFGCKYNGYCSDMTRTVVIGKASTEQKKLYNIVLEANLAVLAMLKAGYQGREIDKVARDIIAANGYGDCFGHGLGHSVGLFIHESPRLSPGEERVIESNVIETVEPGIYVPGFGGVRIEDMVVVTENGCTVLSQSDKNLIEL